jgi:ATP-dependent Lhr-like helicase
VRTTPITLRARRHVAFWTTLAGPANGAQPSPRAQGVLDCLRTQGALFFDELAEASSLLRPQVEEALGELVSLGAVTSDSFGGLRALLVPSDRRKPFHGGTRRRRIMSFGMDDAGRWVLMRRPTAEAMEPQAKAAATEHVARALLRRYGVVFWRLLAREAELLPPWRDLLRVYRRMEARGEIRGGRFVAGFSGEQYALPDAVGMLREVRRRPNTGEFVSLSGADPLNLAGILTPGPKLAALTANRLLFRDGLPIASMAGGEVQFVAALEAPVQWQARKSLLRSATPPVLADLA